MKIETIDFKEVFSTEGMTKIQGDPSYDQIINAKQKIRDRLRIISCSLPHSSTQRYAWILYTKTEFFTKTGQENIVKVPQDQGAYTETNATARARWQDEQEQYILYSKINKQTVQLIRNIFDDDIFIDLEDEDGDLVNLTPQDLFDHLLTEFAGEDEKEK